MTSLFQEKVEWETLFPELLRDEIGTCILAERFEKNKEPRKAEYYLNKAIDMYEGRLRSIQWVIDNKIKY